MTTYTVHPDTIFDPDKPILGSTHLEARDNLIAAFEGAADAPGLSSKAVEDVTAGDVTRVEVPGGGDYEFPVIQNGSVRAVAFVTGGDGSSAGTTISRRRAGVETVLFNGDLSLTRIVDVTIQPGDVVVFSGTVSTVIRYRLRTSGENLWPGSEFLTIA